MKNLLPPYFSRQRGFTLIELMVTLAVLAVLVMVAAPSMERTIKKSSVNGHQRDFMSAVAFARGEASVRGRYVSICPSDNGSTCDVIGFNWTNGWLVFTESGAPDGVYQVGEDLLRVYEYDGSNTIRVEDPLDTFSNLNSLSWTHRGFSNNAQRALAVVCERDNDVQFARGVMIASGGRAISTRDANGDLVHEIAFEQDDGTQVNAELTCP